ncbi:hypothetical protein [Novipirellula artificiosorum]|uniref:Uncharacterized protein n=1 Tax=Novipirellula artificiosorum TaxID=2528016 RepID=A0A5C6E1P1_9BACT|nr:hypothetical protein [Novipirellula artificiosorum]TWU41907.1 hypothetical protein Poly41_02000 [Novipirellula artificiosorum]
MVARDDSVIRGSLIASLIFLVLSLALNAFLWMTVDRQSQDVSLAKESLSSAQSQLRTKEDQVSLMKAMMSGGVTDEEFALLAESASGDPEMEAIEQQYVQNMSLFSADYEERSYAKLPEFLMNAIRSRNDQFREATESVQRIRAQAESDVDNARKAQAVAEQKAADLQKKLDAENQLFTEDRERINKEKEDTRDSLTRMDQEYNAYRKTKTDEITKLSRKKDLLQNTIDNQKLELNKMQSPQFESTQGRIRFVRNDLVTINLGSADQLRPNVTFGVIAGDETRLKDAKVKATIQVTRILDDHLAEARVVARPAIEYPIIPGDQIYSPFWAPGRKVKIAIAGDIDIDNDKRPDTESIKGMIQAAGAEVVAEVAANGDVKGKLDASVRFLVLDDQAESETGDEIDADKLKAIGAIKARARELGVTIIPAWKLQAYLKTINDSLTTPLGSATRGEDFAPQSNIGTNQRYPTALPEIYTRQVEGMQQGNEILSP